MRLGQFGHLGVAARIKHRSGEHEYRAIDQQREKQRDGAVDQREADRLAPFGRRRADRARQHDRRMQKEIMRHDSRADYAEAEIKHARIVEQLARRDEAARDLPEIDMRHGELRGEGKGDEPQERNDEQLDLAKARALEGQHHEGVEQRDGDADGERHAEQKLQADRRADDLGEIGRGDGGLGHEPQRDRGGFRKTRAAGLREVEAGGEPQPRAERLQYDGHQTGEHGREQQRAAVARAGGERGRPIAGVHIAGRDEIAGAEKDEEPPRERGAFARRDGRAQISRPARGHRGGRRRGGRQKGGSGTGKRWPSST